jgi:hypothetical protein
MADGEPKTLKHAEVPLDFGKNLRACMRCKLLKTFEQASGWQAG